MELDGRGIAGVNIITTEFVDAANAQMNALGFEAAVVVVPHPIQNRTTAELHKLADDYFAAVIESISASGRPA
jgi:hypothetical protein